ncbi:hypothetical protein B0H13DRAFT_1909793 [Mycena leptocephala]|nr:hypothetical protein B0H13DRAFT_1909793 [Mycena leptocephala]
MPVFTEEPLTCTRDMDLSPIRYLKPVAPILCFGQQVAVAIWKLTWNIGPFVQKKPGQRRDKCIAWKGCGIIALRGSRNIQSPLIPEWLYYKIDLPAACVHAFKQPKKNEEELKKSRVHRPMSRRNYSKETAGATSYRTQGEGREAWNLGMRTSQSSSELRSPRVGDEEGFPIVLLGRRKEKIAKKESKKEGLREFH